MKQRSVLRRILHRIEYGMLLILSAIFRFLPTGVLYGFVRVLAFPCYHVFRIRRKVVEENLRRAFGMEKTPEEIGRIARESYAHIGMTFAEMLIFPDLAERVLEIVDMSERPALDAAYAKGRGIVMIGCHCGSWEMSGAWWGHWAFAHCRGENAVESPCGCMDQPVPQPVSHEGHQSGRAGEAYHTRHPRRGTHRSHFRPGCGFARCFR